MLKIYLALHAAFWLVLAGISAAAAVRSFQGKRPIPSTLALVVPVGLFSLLIVVVSIHISYVAPLAIMQDIVAAREALAYRPLPTTHIGPLIEKALDDEPRPSSLQPLWPELGQEEDEKLFNVARVLSLQAHPPFMILSFIPLYYLFGVHGTSLAFAVLSVSFLLATLFLIDRELRFDWDWKQKALVVALLFSCEPMSWVLRAGQTGALLAFLVTLSWYWLHKAQFVASGIALGLAVSLKLFPALLLAYFLLRARLSCAAAILTTLALNVLAVLCFGFQSFVEYSRTAHLDASTHAGAFDNCSLFQILTQASYILSVPLLRSFGFYATVSACLIGAVCFAIVSRGPQPPTVRFADVAFSLFVVSSCLLSPLCWSHYFVLLLLPLAVLYRTNREEDASAAKLSLYFGLFAALMFPAELMRLADVFVAAHLSGRVGLLLSMVPGMVLLALAGMLVIDLFELSRHQRLA
jgi:Glycosyltransferase family 87